MKQVRFFTLTTTLVSMLTLASCDNKDGLPTATPRPIQFSAGIGKQAVATPGTRATGTMWNEGDAIGVFMTEHGNASADAMRATNRKYTIGTDSNFTPASGDEIYYPLKGEKVDFIAYYPYTDGANLENALPVSTADQTQQTSFDMLWTRTDNSGTGYDKENGDNAIPLVFSHRLARLTMNIKAAANTGLTDLEGMQVIIHGMNTATTFNPKDGAIGTASTVADMEAHQTATTSGGQYLATYDAIIVPASYGTGSVTVTFTIQGETYTWTQDATEFASGNDYVYEVLLTLTGVTVTGTISPWISVTQGTVYAQ